MSETFLSNEEEQAGRPARVALAPDVVCLHQSNGEVLLQARGNGRYVRVSPAAARLLTRLRQPMALTSLVDDVAAATGVSTDVATEKVTAFVADLRSAGVVTDGSRRVDAPHVEGHDHSGSSARDVLRVALPAWISAPRGALLTAEGAAVALAATVAVMALSLISYLAVGPTVPVDRSPYWAAVGLAVVAGVAVHETAHALADRVLGIPVRAVGIGLLFRFVPFAFIDHTDGHRLDHTPSRILVALAGPAADLFIVGVATAVTWGTSGAVAATSHATAVAFMFSAIFNLNPLLPTDGARAVAAAVGKSDPRRATVLWIAAIGLAYSLASLAIAARGSLRVLEGLS